MRTPTRSIAANLRWTRSGTVWADWILDGLPYGLRPVKDKHTVRGLHQALIRALPGESLLLGVCSGLDPAAVVERMLDGVDLEQQPEWVAECQATLATLDQLGPGQRIYWLSVPLAADRPADRAMEPLRAATADLRDLIGLPRAGVPVPEIRRRLEQAARIEAAIPAPFRPRPASAAQMLWLQQHSLRRGLFQDSDLPGDAADGTEQLSPRGAAALSEPLIDEGGVTDLPKGKRGNPLRRRFVKIEDTAAPGSGGEASYQALLAVADVPDAGMVFPGSELIGRIDESGLDVDWALRLHVRSSATVATSNQRALRNLNEQYGQRDSEVSHALNTLDGVAQDLAEYAAILENDKLEVEAQATIVFCVAGPSADSATEQAAALADHLGASGYRLAQPLGCQEELWWAMTPGVPTTRVVREFAQVTTSRALAATIPLASVRLGDASGSALALNIAHGPLLGPNITCGPTSIALHDLEGATDRDVSGSLAVAGELGAGKSLLLKKLAGDVSDRGGRVISADRTVMGEWAQWAQSVPNAVVVDVSAPALSLDPLRVFGPQIGARITQTFLTPLLNVAPTSPRGVLLSDVLDPAYLAARGIQGLGQLQQHLQNDCQLPDASEVARLLNVFARKDFGRVIFDDTVPALQLHDPVVIIRTHTLQLPSREELEHAHLFEGMGVEKIFGRALYALIAALARQVCFAELDRLGLFVVDEAHSVTISPEGERELVDFVRDGRKHRAAVALGSHDPAVDFGSPTLRGLIPTRILMRHRDLTLARRGLDWLDLDPDDEALIALVRTDMSPVLGDGVPMHRRGECLIRDAAGNVGRGKILPPARAARAAAVLTSGQPRRGRQQPPALAAAAVGLPGQVETGAGLGVDQNRGLPS